MAVIISHSSFVRHIPYSKQNIVPYSAKPPQHLRNNENVEPKLTLKKKFVYDTKFEGCFHYINDDKME
ncbi:9637_t:CDS:2 [Dentiscutata heterogama]|uniref:9637_t:CDS:1 n=1 Tax=Dentiscutata heterogama TaxID=1316150 RepID=A0ACA9JVE4_9GLOM|nr:9637_t:CDS:2 [Dentiscutata heterogama]